MSKELVEKKNTTLVLTDLQDTQALCQMLLKTSHYAKLGPDGIFAVVETAKSLGIDPRVALGGGLYYVKGKVEMSARLMNSLIRAQRHSITRDRKSDNTICILHGKRADNGDTWTESFSLDEAHKAGLANNPVWKNYTRDMLFARALSRLARQLFPDIIGNVYVEGEISLDSNITPPSPSLEQPVEVEELDGNITQAEADELDAIIADDETYRKTVMKFLEKQCKATSLHEMPREVYEKVLPRALELQKIRLDSQAIAKKRSKTQYGEISQVEAA